MFPFIFDDEKDLVSLSALIVSVTLCLFLLWNATVPQISPDLPTISMVGIGILTVTTTLSFVALTIMCALEAWAGQEAKQ